MYNGQVSLSEKQFDDVFASLLNNTSPLYNMLKDEGTNFINVYEAFISMLVFSQGHFDDKL
jgi:hypothetical protein